MESLKETSSKIFKDFIVQIKEIKFKEDEELVIVTTGKNNITIRDNTSQRCCERSMIKHNFKNYKKLIIDSIEEFYHHKYVCEEDNREKTRYYCTIKINTKDGQTFEVECSNSHNGFYSHSYSVKYDDKLLYQFEL